MSYCEDDPRYQLCKVCGAKDCDCTMGDLVALREAEIATLKQQLEEAKTSGIHHDDWYDLRNKYDNAAQKSAELACEIAAVRQQNAELLKDVERMNYVCSVTGCDPKMDGKHVYFGIGGRPLKGGNLRSAIDNELIRMYGKPEMPKEEDAAIANAEGK